jgi:competence protein ComEA
MGDSGRWQMAVYALAGVVAVVGALYLMSGGSGSPRAEAGGRPAVSIDGAGAPAGAAANQARSAGEPIYVHVAGAVRRPGVYRVRAGARLAVAVGRAGGLTRRADLRAFNLAAKLRDAQQVIVPRRGEAQASPAGAAPGQSAPAGGTASPQAGTERSPGQPVSLSRATPEQLDTLDGIGPKLAAAIIAYRDRHGGFKSVEELREVDGIGEKRFATLSKGVRP